MQTTWIEPLLHVHIEILGWYEVTVPHSWMVECVESSEWFPSLSLPLPQIKEETENLEEISTHSFP